MKQKSNNQYYKLDFTFFKTLFAGFSDVFPFLY